MLCPLLLPRLTKYWLLWRNSFSVLSPESCRLLAGNLGVLALGFNAILAFWLVKTGLGFVLVSDGCRVGT